MAHKAGTGATIEVDLGGKVVPDHGKPVHCKATVKRVTDGVFKNTGPIATGLEVRLGPSALLAVDGLLIIVISARTAPNDAEIFRHMGIDPAKKKILVVKSRGHFRASYEPLSKEIVEVDCPGMASPNLTWFTYHNVPRPLWPLDK
jgi:microcystin degradation protein MlrC